MSRSNPEKAPVFGALLDILIPPVCPVCEKDVCAGPLCAQCLSELSSLRITEPFCSVCGIPFLNSPGQSHTCGDCLTAKRPFEMARSAFVYKEKIQDSIHRLKYKNQTGLARPLGRFLAEAIQFRPDVIIPVPLHKKRLRHRGFNQSLLLARVLAGELSIELDYKSLRRVRNTQEQISLTAVERRKNVAGAFEIDKRLAGAKALLVDDVFTTGSTIIECSRVLKEAGAEVYALTLARAIDV